MEGGSAMKGERSQREKHIEGGSAMKGEREGQQGWVTGLGDRDERQETRTDKVQRATATGDK